MLLDGPITRHSFFQTNHKLLNLASTRSSTKYLTFDLDPLSKDGEFVCLGYKDVPKMIGRPHEKNEKTLSNELDPSISPPALVFLRVNLDQDNIAIQLGKYSTAYFALDVSKREACKRIQTSLGFAYKDDRMDLMESQSSSAILPHSRSLADWNKQNPCCSSCGRKTMSTHAGDKAICPPSAGRSCPTRIRLHNQAFPRTDPTAIIVPISYDSKRVLLGRNRRCPDNYFSALSGFVELGESIEKAVRREEYEEAGVKIDRVQIHFTQRWPYASTLLIGAMGQFFEDCEDDACPETDLEEEKWFTLLEIPRALDEGANAV